MTFENLLGKGLKQESSNKEEIHDIPLREPYRKVLHQFGRYVVVGGLAFLVDFGTLFTLTHYADFHYLVSATAGFLLGLLVNYLICIRWIFDFRALSDARHEFAVFAGVGVAGLILNNGIIYALTEWADIHYLSSKVIAAGLILIFNFSLRRTLLFSERKSLPSEPSATQPTLAQTE